MKKNYETPIAEKISFRYQEQVVASNTCISTWINIGSDACIEGNQYYQPLN